MPYYGYNAGNCEHCGNPLGFIEVNGGRQRHYCTDKCKTAAYRERKQEEYRNKTLLRNTELRDYWQEVAITGSLLSALQDILVEHGKDAARAATDTVLLAQKLSHQDAQALQALQERLTSIETIEQRFRTDVEVRHFKPWLKKHLQPRDSDFAKRFLADTRFPQHASRSLYEAKMRALDYSKEDIYQFQEAWKAMLLGY